MLVHAASGGVGQMAVQVAVALGSEVIGTASPGNHDLVRSLGATTVLDHGAGPVSEQLADHGGKVDAVLDLAGGDALADAPAQVADTTRIVSVIDPQTVIGMGGRYVFVRPDRGHLDALAELVDDGRLRVTVARTFDLDDIAEAHRLSQEGHPGGKIAIRV